jgi:DNA polymerase-3 subunit epsilon
MGAMLFAVVDIETTGGNFHKDRIIEIAVVIHDGHKIVDEYTSLVNPGQPIIPFIVNLTGINNEMVRNAPDFGALAQTIYDITHDKIFVAHNAKFDYGFLKAEFRRANLNFRCKQLCTVEMSRKVFPGMRSYSLGNLCNDLNISINGRHRAYGDAAATACLLEKMLIRDSKAVLQSIQADEFETIQLPPDITREVLDHLPDETGVYYLHDANGKVLFIGKAKNIRTQVPLHFKQDLKDLRSKALAERTSSITYELSGNELMAGIMEAAELRKFSPEFNAIQRKPRYKYGLYLQEDEEGYVIPKVLPLKDQEAVIQKFTHQLRAERMVEQVLKRTQLQHHLRKTHQKNHYNQKVIQAISGLAYPHPNCLIIDQGRSGQELTCIWIHNYEYRGFTFFDPEYTGQEIERILEKIRKSDETPDVKRQIQQYIRKKRKYLQIIPL